MYKTNSSQTNVVITFKETLSRSIAAPQTSHSAAIKITDKLCANIIALFLHLLQNLRQTAVARRT